MSALTSETKARLLEASVFTLTNLLLRRGLRNACMDGVLPLLPAARLAGPAFTLRFIPSREDIDTMAGYASDENVHRRAIVIGGPVGVMVLPAHLANEIAEEAAEVGAYEEFVAGTIAGGRSIFGLFTATAASRQEYETRRAGRTPR